MLDNNLTSRYIDRPYGNFPEREEDHNRESYTIGSSLGGKLGSRFKWEAFWQYGHVTDNVTEANSPWKSHWIATRDRSEEHTSELQSLMRISYAVFCLKKKKTQPHIKNNIIHGMR